MTKNDFAMLGMMSRISFDKSIIDMPGKVRYVAERTSRNLKANSTLF